jgi:hypothetical protein
VLFGVLLDVPARRTSAVPKARSMPIGLSLVSEKSLPSSGEVTSVSASPVQKATKKRLHAPLAPPTTLP